MFRCNPFSKLEDNLLVINFMKSYFAYAVFLLMDTPYFDSDNNYEATKILRIPVFVSVMGETLAEPPKLTELL